MSKQKVTFWLLCCTVLCFSVQRLEMQFRECFGYSREEFEEILAKHNREKEAEFMEGDVFGGLLMETVSAPLIAIEGIQNQWRARTGRKTDYSFLEGRDQTRSEVTAGMGSIGTALYLGAADITSQLTLAMLTFGRDKAMAGAMGSMYMDTMQHRKEREGVDELKAADTALLTGMADYYLGNLGYRHISRCVEEGVRKSLVRKMGESFLTGAGMALGSETGGQLIDWMLNGRLSEWGKIYNAHLDEGMSETEAFGEMVKDVGPELTAHTVEGGISGAGFAVIHMLAASKDNRLRKQETIEKTNQGGERNRNESGSDVGNIAKKFDTNNIPNMTKQDIIDSIPDDWNYTEHNGFVHIRDADGDIRIRIDPPDKVTQYPHVHAYDSVGNLLDSVGNIVDRKSPDGHIPYKDN